MKDTQTGTNATRMVMMLEDMNMRLKQRPDRWPKIANATSVVQVYLQLRRIHCIIGAVVVFLALPSTGQEVLETMRIGGVVYSNVTVMSKTRTDVFIKFSGGMANIKVRELDEDVQSLLGYQVAPVKKKSSNSPAVVAKKIQADPRVQEMQSLITKQVETNLRQLDPRILWGLLGAALVSYVFFCQCCVMICKKTGFEPGVLVWLPVLQAFPLLKAAGMPPWWFLWFLLPVLNLIASVVWCLKIAKARNKSPLTAVMLMLPGTNLLAFLYLAFSDGNGGSSGETRITFR